MTLLQLFKALGDSTRLRIAHILFNNELSVNELVQILGMGQSRVSRHLKIMAEAGILQFRRDGLWVFYSVPAQGDIALFFNSILPFLPADAQTSKDLDMAAKKVEERSHKTRQFFNTIAQEWDNLNHDILGDFDLARIVANAVPAGCKSAVDLGCGTGEVLQQLISRSETVIGVDGSAKMLEVARTRLADVKDPLRLSLRIGELHHLPLADREVDFVSINLVLHHLHAPESVFPEIARIMAPGATLFISDFIRHDDESMRSQYGDHWLGLNPDEICSALRNNNFVVESRQLQPVGKHLTLFLIMAKRVSNLEAYDGKTP